jgi:hypothetical protein
MKPIIALFLFQLIRPSFALSLDRELFRESYQDDYQSLMCSHNMMSLIETFSSSGLPLHDTYIVHVRALNAPFVEVRAYQARGEGTQRWSFHAFMVRDGKVFDMDFRNSQENPSFKNYIKEMFFPKEALKQKLLFQVKPAEDYAKEDFDGSMDTSLYPLRDFDSRASL